MTTVPVRDLTVQCSGDSTPLPRADGFLDNLYALTVIISNGSIYEFPDYYNTLSAPRTIKLQWLECNTEGHSRDALNARTVEVYHAYYTNRRHARPSLPEIDQAYQLASFLGDSGFKDFLIDQVLLWMRTCSNWKRPGPSRAALYNLAGTVLDDYTSKRRARLFVVLGFNPQQEDFSYLDMFFTPTLQRYIDMHRRFLSHCARRSIEGERDRMENRVRRGLRNCLFHDHLTRASCYRSARAPRLAPALLETEHNSTVPSHAVGSHIAHSCVREWIEDSEEYSVGWSS